MYVEVNDSGTFFDTCFSSNSRKNCIHSTFCSQHFNTTFVVDGTAFPSWLRLEAVIENLHGTYQCRTYSKKLL